MTCDDGFNYPPLRAGDPPSPLCTCSKVWCVCDPRFIPPCPVHGRVVGPFWGEPFVQVTPPPHIRYTYTTTTNTNTTSASLLPPTVEATRPDEV